MLYFTFPYYRTLKDIAWLVTLELLRYLRRVFFYFEHLRGQKYYNNLLQPVVISSLNRVCFAPGYDFDGRSDHFDS